MVVGSRWALERDGPGFHSASPFAQRCGKTQQLASLFVHLGNVSSRYKSPFISSSMSVVQKSNFQNFPVTILYVLEDSILLHWQYVNHS